MVKNDTIRTSAVGLILVVVIGLIVVYVPITTEETVVQCITTPCPPIIETKTLIDMLFPEEELIACILLFAPVCGINGETFDNACFAGAEGVEILHNGECSGDEAMVLTQDPSTFCKIYPTASGCQ